MTDTLQSGAESAIDLDKLTRYDHRGALMVPDSTGDYFLVSDVRALARRAAAPHAAEQYADILAIQRREAESGPQDDYMRGLYNGMAMMVANFENSPKWEPMHKPAVGSALVASKDEQQDQASVMPPFAAPASQHEASIAADAFILGWDAALSDAAFYVAGHCADGDFHAEHVFELRAPALKFKGELASGFREGRNAQPKSSDSLATQPTGNAEGEQQ